MRPISVTVVTKPAKREVEAPEPTETEVVVLTPVVPPVETPQMASPKPFVKLEVSSAIETKDQDKDASPSLQLKGLGLNGVDNLKLDPSHAKLGKPKPSEQKPSSPSKVLQSTSSSRLPARLPARQPARQRARKRAPPPETLSPSSSALTLQGARLKAPINTDKVQTIEKPKEVTGFEGMTPLSKAERERLWQEFATEPLSASVHEAYAILYPQTYAHPATSTERQGQKQVQLSAGTLPPGA